jgi:hypothetical protein
MNVPQIQSQLALNRELLKWQHEILEDAKECRKYFSDEGNDVYATREHKHVVMTRKKIARMAVLQKALKADLAILVRVSRANKRFWEVK